MGAHWILLVLDVKQRSMLWFDSLRESFVTAALSHGSRDHPPSGGVSQKSSGGVSQKSSDAPAASDSNGIDIRSSHHDLFPGWVVFRNMDMLLYHLTAEGDRKHYIPWSREIVVGLPQQIPESVDCGVFMCSFARCIGDGALQSLSVDFDGRYVDEMRCKMALLIVEGRIP
eukprot:GHVO01066695.1.p1 GENE.GHVO01066695.1~~GHVO01066695.1.p1  ORF type:complete len:171 (-),score=33.98 GHVO01066695.1:188-700(-)